MPNRQNISYQFLVYMSTLLSKYDKVFLIIPLLYASKGILMLEY